MINVILLEHLVRMSTYLYHFCSFRCVKQCAIAVNSVINWSFFFYYTSCFSIIPSNFINSESGVTICNQFRIKKPDTWRHRASDHSTRHRTFPIPIGDHFGTKPLSPALFELLACHRVSISSHFRDNGHQTYWDHDVDHSRSRDVIVTW